MKYKVINSEKYIKEKRWLIEKEDVRARDPSQVERIKVSVV